MIVQNELFLVMSVDGKCLSILLLTWLWYMYMYVGFSLDIDFAVKFLSFLDTGTARYLSRCKYIDACMHVVAN